MLHIGIYIQKYENISTPYMLGCALMENMSWHQWFLWYKVVGFQTSVYNHNISIFLNRVRASRKAAAKKEDEARDDQPAVKKDEEDSENNDSDDEEREKEDIDVRDVRYKLEPLSRNVILFSWSSPFTFSDMVFMGRLYLFSWGLFFLICGML